MEQFISSREPLSALKKLDLPDSAAVIRSLIEHFDMFRVIHTKSVRNAFRFAYLEHVLRVSTPHDEFNQMMYSVAPSLQCKLSQASRKRVISNSRPFKFLEDVLTEEDLDNLDEPSYRGVKLKVAPFMEQSVFLQRINKAAPILYVLNCRHFNVVLYPELVTYLDGFDPCTGVERQPLVAASLLAKARQELYSQFRDHQNELVVVPKCFLSLSDRTQTRELLEAVQLRIQSRELNVPTENNLPEPEAALLEKVEVHKKRYVEDRSRSCCSADRCLVF